MKAVTLYGQDRFSLLSTLPEPHIEQICKCMNDTHGITELDVDNLTAWDIERYLEVNYVDKNRDLSSISPIENKDYFIFHDRDNFQPLLDALAKGDFELAEALTPPKCRLCGYKEFKDITKVEQHGIGWAGQFEITEVPPGIYPIFANKFHYHERDRHFTNEIDYLGIWEWYAGSCVASSDDYFNGPEPNVVIKSPYAYSLAEAADKGIGNAHLIYPFKAVATEHTNRAGGKPFIHYTIVDTTTPYNAPSNPLYFRGRCSPRDKTRPSLDEKIQKAESSQTQQHNSERNKGQATR